MEEDLLRMYKKAFSMNEGTFRNEAALRDIFVLETDGQDWHSFLPFLHASPYAVEFLIDGEQRPLPEHVADLFALTQDGPVIRIDKEHLAIDCFCFAEEGMEFDISAKDFQDEATIREQIARLLNFIRTIGRVLNKVILLAPEVSPHFPLFRFDTESLVCWIAEREGIKQDTLGIKGKSGILQSMTTRAAFLHDPTHTIVFSYTPKHASWMNQVEIWLSILVRKLLKRGNFRSLEDLKAQILAFVAYYNRTMAHPFKWTYQGLTVDD